MVLPTKHAEPEATTKHLNPKQKSKPSIRNPKPSTPAPNDPNPDTLHLNRQDDKTRLTAPNTQALIMEAGFWCII